MATNPDSQHHTRAATRAGVRTPPPPLYSPLVQSMSFGSIEAGEISVDSVSVSTRPSVASAARPSVAIAARPAGALASGTVTPVARTPSDAGDVSSELPSLLESQVDFGGRGDLPVRGVSPVPRDSVDDGGWTPVTRKTSHSHRERSISNTSKVTSHSESEMRATKSGTESTVAQATHEMSPEELSTLAHRYEAYAAQLRAEMARAEQIRKVSENERAPPANKPVVKPDPVAKEQIREHSECPTTPEPAAPPQMRRAHRVTVEEVDEEDDPLSIRPAAGPSRDKGKGPDPRNWGDIHSLRSFSEDEMRAQREALDNFAEINRIIKQEEFTPHLEFSDEVSQRPSSPRVKKPRKRSKSPKFVEKIDLKARPDGPNLDRFAGQLTSFK
ncbi:hypothetical protein R3P38DRAFT_3469860 [Favolaschia claudopus]|uniref:Uncharacterized protein n=1 Tax=Favolaschia claudopus TaxID=2862362 RepID=A0AAV9ZDR1_9AGAR